MKKKSMLVIIAIACSPILSLGQGGNSGSSQSSAPAASQGSATIENQIIAYEVLRQIAGQIADRVEGTCKPPGCSKVLWNEPAAQSGIATGKAFDQSVKALIQAYQAAPAATGGVATAEAFAPSLSDIASLLTAIKSSATYSNQNFQPTSQSMITFLSLALKKKGLVLRTWSLPGNLDNASDAVQKELGQVFEARKAASKRVQDIKDKEARSTAEKALADLDKEFSALRTALTATSPDGTVLATIIKEKALLDSLGTPYSVLTLSVDAAGGDTKVTHFFWRELFWPTPNPSYSGGAVVSFLLTDPNGSVQDGDQFHYMYGFSKLKSPKVPKSFSVKPPQP